MSLPLIKTSRGPATTTSATFESAIDTVLTLFGICRVTDWPTVTLILGWPLAPAPAGIPASASATTASRRLRGDLILVRNITDSIPPFECLQRAPESHLSGP